MDGERKNQLNWEEEASGASGEEGEQTGAGGRASEPVCVQCTHTCVLTGPSVGVVRPHLVHLSHNALWQTRRQKFYNSLKHQRGIFILYFILISMYYEISL